MKKRLITLAIAGAVATPFAVQAGSLTVPNQDITLSGGITGAYRNQTDTKKDAFVVDDALLDFASEAKTGGLGFDLGLGTFANNSLYAGSQLNSIGNGGTITAQYGWVSVMPMEGLKIDAGKLATNVGYELVPSYLNAQALHGLVWNDQPAYYTGARATYSTGDMSFYAEANKNAFPTAGGGPGSGFGASATMGPVFGAVNVVSAVNEVYIVDFIASGKAGNIDLAANIDYIGKSKALKNATPNTDDNATGIALYASFPVAEKTTLPIRFEYINDGTSNLYGLTNSASGATSKSAYTFSISPTYNFTKATFVRGSISYVSTDKKSLYVDDQNHFTDTSLTVGAQAGVLF
jgi:hypothetical protein